MQHVSVPYSEGIMAMERGICDAVVAYSTDVGKIRRAMSKWKQYTQFRVIMFP